MKQFQFKTNIKCSGCIENVTPFLNGESRIQDWKVNTEDPRKILTIQTRDLNAQDIQSLLARAGYKAELL